MTEQCKMLYKAKKQRNGHTNKNAHAIKILSVEQVDENRIQCEKVTRTEGTNSTINACTLYKIK